MQVEGRKLKVRKRFPEPAVRATRVGLREFQLQSGLQGVEFRALVLEGFHSDFVWDLIPIP